MKGPRFPRYLWLMLFSAFAIVLNAAQIQGALPADVAWRVE